MVPAVLFELPSSGLAVVTLNNPDRLNALSTAMVSALHSTLDFAEAVSARFEGRSPRWATEHGADEH